MSESSHPPSADSTAEARPAVSAEPTAEARLAVSAEPTAEAPHSKPDSSLHQPESSSDKELNQLDPKIVRVWRLKSGFFAIFLLLGAVTYDIFNIFQDDRSIPLGIVTLVTLTVVATLVIWLPALRYRYWGYELTENELFLVRGVFNRVRTVVPLRRIQHLDVSQDLVEREYDLAKLIVHTAGTRSSDVTLPGLAIGEAERLREIMKTSIIDEAL